MLVQAILRSVGAYFLFSLAMAGLALCWSQDLGGGGSSSLLRLLKAIEAIGKGNGSQSGVTANYQVQRMIAANKHPQNIWLICKPWYEAASWRDGPIVGKRQVNRLQLFSHFQSLTKDSKFSKKWVSKQVSTSRLQFEKLAFSFSMVLDHGHSMWSKLIKFAYGTFVQLIPIDPLHVSRGKSWTHACSKTFP